MATTKIEWTEKVWNPVTGCTKVSQGCKNCYAETMANRFWKDRKFSDVQCHKDRLMQPFHWRKRKRVFVNSMSDLFHEDVSFKFIAKVFNVMSADLIQRKGKAGDRDGEEAFRSITKHEYIILTKRPARILEFINWVKENGDSDEPFMHEFEESNEFPYNIWVGVSVEDQQTADERIPLLLQIPAAVRFISAEPLLGAINLEQIDSQIREHRPNSFDRIVDVLEEIEWVIVGGESGKNARPMHPDWARSLRDQCKDAGVPFFFKQWGEYIHVEQMFAPNKLLGYSGPTYKKLGKKKSGRLLDGIEHNEYPIIK